MKLILLLFILASCLRAVHVDYEYWRSKDDNGMFCRWSGTTPFCSGACDDDEIQTWLAQMLGEGYSEEDKDRFGSACLVGWKVKCCLPSQRDNRVPRTPSVLHR